jgi:hypothetical protein
MNSVIKSIQVLALPVNDLTEVLPQIETTNNIESKEIKDKLVSLLGKVDEMKTQRDELLKRLQRSVEEDDLTKSIAAQQNEIKNEYEFFKQNLKKHEQLVMYLDQNLQAQDNILRALADTNASFAADRQKIQDATHKRNLFIDGLVFSYQSIEDLSEKAEKGVVFFESLNDPIDKLFQNVKEFCEKSKQERETQKRFMDRLNYRAANIMSGKNILMILKKFQRYDKVRNTNIEFLSATKL